MLKKVRKIWGQCQKPICIGVAAHSAWCEIFCSVSRAFVLKFYYTNQVVACVLSCQILCGQKLLDLGFSTVVNFVNILLTQFLNKSALRLVGCGSLPSGHLNL